MQDLYSTDPSQELVLDHANDPVPTRQHDLDHTDQDQEYISQLIFIRF